MAALGYKSKSYVNFVRGIKTESSRIDYDNALHNFMKYIKKTDPDQLLQGPTEKLEDDIMDFIAWQKERGLAYMTMRQRVAAIRHFYEMNRKPLSWKVITRTIGKVTAKKDRGYTHEEIQKMLQVAKPREQVAMLLMASGGLRVGALPGLRLKHLKRLEKHGIYRVTVYEGEEEEYVTFCTPEAAQAIDRYLEFRKLYGEIITDESPLLRDEFDKRDLETIRHAKFMENKGIRSAIIEIAHSAGVRQKIKCEDGVPGKVRHPVKILHGLKKFAATNMVRAKVERTYKEYMLSHKKGRKDVGVDVLEMIYDRPEESDLLNEYLKAVPFLTVNQEEKLKLKVDELESEVSDIDMMKRNYFDMKLREEQRQQEMIEIRESHAEFKELLKNPKKLLELLKENESS